MADESSSSASSFGQAQVNSKRSKKSILVHSSATSLADLLFEIGEPFPDNVHLEALDYKCTLKEKDFDTVVKVFEIKEPYKAHFPHPNDRSCNWTGELCVYKEMLEAGFRFPPHPFVCRILAEAKVCPTQLHPNAWKIIFVFLAQCAKKKIEPSVAVFRRLFHFKKTPSPHAGWVHLQHRSHNVTHIFKSDSLPDSVPNWKGEFFFVEWVGHDWSSLFRTKFGSVVDGNGREVKLGREESEGMTKLGEDNCQTHYMHILWEDNLQELGLSTLGPIAREHLKILLSKKKEKANTPSATVTKRSLRRKRDDTISGPTAFQQSNPVKVPDEATFAGDLGMRNCDYILDSMKLPMDWSKSSITPDRENIVEPVKVLDEATCGCDSGIRNCDFVLGSTKLSKEWSKGSITPDRENIVEPVKVPDEATFVGDSGITNRDFILGSTKLSKECSKGSNIPDRENIVELVKVPDEAAFAGDLGIRSCDSILGSTDLSKEWSKGSITPDRENIVESVKVPEEATFVGDLGIRKCDSIMGSTKLSKEWSKGSITPDRENIVEAAPTDSIKTMGFQALASANVYFQTAFNQMEAMERKVDLQEREINRLKEDVSTWRTRYERVEMERVEAVQALDRLKEKVAMSKATTIAEYRASPAYQKNLKEYTKKLPKTSIACWDQVIEMIQEKYPEYELSRLVCPFARPT